MIDNPEIQKLLVNAKATYYRGFIRVWIPDQPYIHYPKGIEHKQKQVAERLDSDEDAVLYETNIERSLRRTKKAIKDYVYMNDFEWFVTFTFASDRHDDVKIRRKLATWLRNQRKRNGRFRYLIVAERHKSGAIHFHGLLGGYTGKLPYALNPHTGRKIPDGRGDYVHNLGEYKLGHNKVEKIKDSLSTVRYIQKYITKENLVEFRKNRYWVSKNLARPKIEENPQPYYKVIDADRQYVLDHGTILEFDKGTHPLIDIFIDSQWREDSK